MGTASLSITCPFGFANSVVRAKIMFCVFSQNHEIQFGFENYVLAMYSKSISKKHGRRKTQYILGYHTHPTCYYLYEPKFILRGENMNQNFNH